MSNKNQKSPAADEKKKQEEHAKAEAAAKAFEISEENELSPAERAELVLKEQERKSAIEGANLHGLDIYERKDGSYVRLNRFPATIAKAAELGWKKVE